MTPLELIESARNLIAEPAHWCQNAPARLADGTSTAPDNPHATQWCGGSALAYLGADEDEAFKTARKLLDTHVMREHGEQTFTVTLANQPFDMKYTRLWQVNDHLGHEAVLNIYDLAINSAP